MDLPTQRPPVRRHRRLNPSFGRFSDRNETQPGGAFDFVASQLDDDDYDDLDDAYDDDDE